MDAVVKNKMFVRCQSKTRFLTLGKKCLNQPEMIMLPYRAKLVQTEKHALKMKSVYHLTQEVEMEFVNASLILSEIMNTYAFKAQLKKVKFLIYIALKVVFTLVSFNI